jgi:hypothetical protein
LSRFGRGIAAGSPVFGEDTGTTTVEALAAGRNNGSRNLPGPYAGNGFHVRDYIADYHSREHGKLSPEEEDRALYTGLFKVLSSEREARLALMAARQFDDLPETASAEVDAAFGQVLALIEEVVATEAEERHITDFDLVPTVLVMYSMVSRPPCMATGWESLHRQLRPHPRLDDPVDRVPPIA